MTSDDFVRSITELLACQLKAELERACAALLAEGLPVAEVKCLIRAGAEAQLAQLEVVGAQLERDFAAAFGQSLTIH